MQAEKDDRPELARHLKSRHVQLIAIGGTIGTGLFWALVNRFTRQDRPFYLLI